MTLSIGDKAPDFTLKDQHGEDITLSTYARDKAVLIVFYPFALSGVCTGELTGLRDRLGDFETDHSTLVAVSCDPMYTQRAVADRDGIFFPLLSDFWPHGADGQGLRRLRRDLGRSEALVVRRRQGRDRALVGAQRDGARHAISTPTRSALADLV